MPGIRIAPVDHTVASVAREIHTLQLSAYAQEARLLGAVSFPPLRRTVDDIVRSAETFIAAYCDESLAGVVSVGLDQGRAGNNISSLVVAPEFQRRGIGRRLLARVIRDYGSAPLTVQTGAENLPALTLYASSGFAETGRWRSGEDQLELVELHRSGTPDAGVTQ